MAEGDPQEIVLTTRPFSSLPQEEVLVVIDVAHLGKIGSSEKHSLKDLLVKLHIHGSLPESQGL